MMWSNLNKAVIASLAFLAGPCAGHMILVSPKPFAPAGGGLSNSPLTSGQFPCRPEGDAATWFSRNRTTPNTMAVGEKQTLSFGGTAVHGGGSCQLALTRDLNPTASSSWEVILSVEGGCPAKDGQTPSTYDFTIPQGIAPGEYVFSWSWIARLSGVREYYQNCAPVTVTDGGGGGAARASASAPGGYDSDQDHESTNFDNNNEDNNGTAAAGARFEALRAASVFPELFVANLADINDCKTADSADVKYPDAGPNVQRPNPNANFLPITGDLAKCIPKVPGGGGGAAPPSAPPASLPPASSGAAGGGSDSTTPGLSSPTSTRPAATASSGGVGGGGTVFTTEPPTGASPTSAAPTTMSTATRPSVTAISPPTASGICPVSTSAPAPSTGGGGGSGGGGGLLAGACTDEGAFNCDGKSFQRCAAGVWSATVPLAKGTTCRVGVSSSLWA